MRRVDSLGVAFDSCKLEILSMEALAFLRFGVHRYNVKFKFDEENFEPYASLFTKTELSTYFVFVNCFRRDVVPRNSMQGYLFVFTKSESECADLISSE